MIRCINWSLGWKIRRTYLTYDSPVCQEVSGFDCYTGDREIDSRPGKMFEFKIQSFYSAPGCELPLICRYVFGNIWVCLLVSWTLLNLWGGIVWKFFFCVCMSPKGKFRKKHVTNRNTLELKAISLIQNLKRISFQSVKQWILHAKLNWTRWNKKSV